MSAGATVMRALGGGTAGAIALTALHELTRRTVPHAPRMDVIGMRALSKTVRAMGRRPARGDRLFRQTLIGDLAANALYYSLAAGGRRSPQRGLLLGAAAGLGAAVLPPLLGLGRSPGARWPVTPVMTVALYTLGGLAAGAAAIALGSDHGRKPLTGPCFRRPRVVDTTVEWGWRTHGTSPAARPPRTTKSSSGLH